MSDLTLPNEAAFKLEPRAGNIAIVGVQVAPPDPLKAGPGWAIYALSKPDSGKGVVGMPLGVAPGEGPPVIKGDIRQCQFWSAAYLVGFPVTIVENRIQLINPEGGIIRV